MEIKTGEEIYAEGLDKIWYNKKSNYDDATTKDRKMFGLKKWVALDDLLKFINTHRGGAKRNVVAEVFAKELPEVNTKSEVSGNSS